MPAHRPTTLQIAARACPHAVTLYEQGAPRDRRGFAYGTAAHEHLRAVVDGDDLDALFRRLVSVGRDGEDAEGPLSVDAVVQGWDLARAWLRVHPIPPDAAAEVPLAMDAEGRPCDHEAGYVRTRIDLIAPCYDEAEDLTGVLVRDYKGSWRAEDEIDSLQRRIQAVLAWDAYPEAEFVRVEIGALRTWQVHSRTLYRERDEDTNEAWRNDVLQAARALDESRAPSPGANCLRCDYAHVCEFVWALARDQGAGVVRQWAAAEAVRQATAGLAREATRDGPIDGIGYYPKTSETPGPGAARAALRWWEARTGVALPGEYVDALAGFVDALGLGSSAIEKLGKKLAPKKDGATARAELAAATLTTQTVRQEWGRIPDE